MLGDFIFVLRWWGVLFAIGLIFFPLTRLLFTSAKDSFYFFSKFLGIGIISYLALLLGTLHVLQFTTLSLLLIIAVSFLANAIIWKKFFPAFHFRISKIIIFEEILFFVTLLFWSFVRAHEPSIHSLEKFMDFGFVNSILRTTYFPPRDMWFTPFSINYYFFGHLCTAVLTRLSGISSNITYNLMLATLFASTFTGGFSLVYNFLGKQKARYSFLGGLLGGGVLSLAGNLHTIYAFFASYTGDHPVPPWTLAFQPDKFPNAYWYPNATRFIPFTIHEFPIYSFVVSDLHGHVTDIPFVLTTLALLFSTLQSKKISRIKLAVLSLLLAIMYMTNVWDGIIYLLLSLAVLIFIHAPLLTFHFKKGKHFIPFSKITNIKPFLENFIFEAGILILLYALFTLPFSVFFKPFVSGIGILCAPTFLTNKEKLGPFLFEANHCQRSPFYQLLILYGFFYFFATMFLVGIVRMIFKILKKRGSRLSQRIFLKDNSHIFITFLILLATLLIIIPEFMYAKDIYPQHYRANTMFKLVYQSFMLLSLSSAYIIVYFAASAQKIWKAAFLSFTFVLLVLVFLYPYFAVQSYYGNFFQTDAAGVPNFTKLAPVQGLDGTAYLKKIYPGDLEAINFLNKTISGQPVILEAQGDSYTDYARISANTGLPTVLGWTVHEWLWRGTYDVPAPRIEEVKNMYTAELPIVKSLLEKYHVAYAIIGPLEYQKYPSLNKHNFEQLGKEIFKSTDHQTVIYKVNA